MLSFQKTELWHGTVIILRQLRASTTTTKDSMAFCYKNMLSYLFCDNNLSYTNKIIL